MNIDLFIFIKNKEFDKLLEFIKKNEDIDLDCHDENYNYFIQYIIMYNNIDILKYVLENKTIRLDIIDNDGRNLLYNPIKYNYHEILKLLLEYDKKNIGMSILDVRDNMSYTGIHYAIIFNNITAFHLLYNIINNIINNNDNLYNICLQYKRTDILLFILENEMKKNHSISHFLNNTGESILQSAINYDDKKVIYFILNHKDLIKQLVNNKEHEYGLTALHQSIVLNTTSSKDDVGFRLIENGADINMSDYLGNTPLHYCIIEKNYEFAEFLLSKSNILYSVTNLNGNTPLHLLLEDDRINITISEHKINYNILLKMLENTDINIMNNEGNTILHYIALKDLWLLPEIKNILINSNFNMNIFIINKENNNILDLVNKNDYKNQFIDIVVKNYYNSLKKIKDKSSLTSLTLDWEKICASKDNKKYCISMIRKQIINKISIPTYKELKLNIDNGIYVEGCYYTGSTIDILFGLLYLTKEHNNVSVTLEYPLTNNKELEHNYIKMGLNYNFKLDFTNIEIVWSYMKLIFQTNFESILKNRINKSHFLIIPLGINVSMGSHANIIIIDTNKKIIERFEPNGINPPSGFYYNPELLDKLLKNKFIEILPEYIYIAPSEYLPTIGFQILETIEENKCKKIGDPNGFCAVWCIWWVEQKLINYDIDSKELALELIKQIKLSNKSFKKLIRNYSIKISQLRDEYLSRVELNIDQWMNGEYNEKIISDIEKMVLDKINL